MITAEQEQYVTRYTRTLSLIKALDPSAIKEMNRQLSDPTTPQKTAASYLEIIHPKHSDFVETHTRGVRPWMGFFAIWSALLGWKYSMDMEAFHIAQKLGKKICYLETIHLYVPSKAGMLDDLLQKL